jgi:hypothetical protein
MTRRDRQSPFLASGVFQDAIEVHTLEDLGLDKGQAGAFNSSSNRTVVLPVEVSPFSTK